MDARIRRFNKEKHLLPTIQINDTYQNMQISPELTLTIPTNYPFVPPLLKINNMYYLPHLEESPVKNHLHLEKNIIITGPNASGKTTFIKTLMNFV